MPKPSSGCANDHKENNVKDVSFTFCFQPDSASEYVARMAVLHPLSRLLMGGKIPKTDEERRALMNRIVKIWRQRVSALCQLGTLRFSSREISWARNCAVWGYAVKKYGPSTPFCKRRDICPWCYGREVSALYHIVERVIQPEDAIVTATSEDCDNVNMTSEQLRRKLWVDCYRMSGLVRAIALCPASFWS